MRLPVALKIAFNTAGAATAMVGSPTPPQKPPERALIGVGSAALQWKLARRALVWYFATVTLVNLVDGTLATISVALLSLEIASAILMLGAQIFLAPISARQSISFV